LKEWLILSGFVAISNRARNPQTRLPFTAAQKNDTEGTK